MGDKLGVIARGPLRRLTDDGLFVANFDTRGVRVEDGAPAGARLTRDLRAAGLTYEPRTRRISCQGRREITLPYSYLGSDDQAGPNYTASPPSTPTMPAGRRPESVGDDLYCPRP
ncbi:hypothetical protein [Nonomuraea dietziae]|uniref:hypothetical protein n=1 Tax=Nonomuraea dietziae TaxID=65515 RepID=UPI0031D67B77